MRLADLPIRTKLLLASGALTAASLFAIVGISLWIMSNTATADAEARARALLGEYARTISGEMEESIAIAQVTAGVVESLVEHGDVNRDMLGAIFAGVTGKNRQLVGMTLAFEPNALDGKDAEFRNHPYSDSTGRFVPYFFNKPDGSIGIEKLVMTKEAGTESWYDMPMAANRSLVTPPYNYPVDGKDVLMTTTSVVIHRDQKPIGIATTDRPLSGISEFVTKLKPFEDGKVMLVGTGGLWIAHQDAALLGKPVEDEAVKTLMQGAARGETANLDIADADGVRQHILAQEVDLPGMKERWLLVMSVPQATLYATVSDARNKMLIAAGANLAAVLALVFFGSGFLARPITRMTQKMRALASGDTSIVVDGIDRKDEIGEMARAVDVFRSHEVERLANEEARERERTVQETRQKAVEDMIARFREASKNMIDQANRASDDLSAVSGELTTSATASQSRADSAKEASLRASANVQSVASAAEQLGASITEIAGQIARTSAMVGEAAQGARAADGKVTALSAAASRIGEIVGLIEAIAQQTNLLALNATIEAARAGEAGRGFAVVASEVKALATQTARATEEISGQISAIQAETDEAAQAIRAIAATMEDVNGFASAIAAAIEQQSASTNEIVSNIDSAASGTGAVANDIAELNAAVVGTNSSAVRVLHASRTVNTLTDKLEEEIDGFLRSVAAA